MWKCKWQPLEHLNTYSLFICYLLIIYSNISGKKKKSYCHYLLIIRANPKSANLTISFLVSSIFSGFTSRWMQLCAWQNCTACNNWYIVFLITASGHLEKLLFINDCKSNHDCKSPMLPTISKIIAFNKNQVRTLWLQDLEGCRMHGACTLSFPEKRTCYGCLSSSGIPPSNLPFHSVRFVYSVNRTSSAQKKNLPRWKLVANNFGKPTTYKTENCWCSHVIIIKALKKCFLQDQKNSFFHPFETPSKYRHLGSLWFSLELWV